jgi:glycosyltransferase involved in cell wall biosynthesis
MRVVHAVGWYFPQSTGGTEVYVAAVARELRRAGVDVHIAAPAPGASKPEAYEHDGVPVYRYPIPVRPTRAEARGEVVVRGAESFHDWLTDLRPDVVHMHTFVTGLDWLEVKHARAAGARVFVTSHSSALGYVCLRGTLLRWGHEICDGVARAPLCAACALQMRGMPRPFATAIAVMPVRAARMVNRIEHPLGTALGLRSHIDDRLARQRELFNAIDTFFALTEASRSTLLANGAPSSKIRVNRLGVDGDVIATIPTKPRRAQVPVVVGFLGRFDRLKGIEDLLRAAQSLPPDVPFRLELRGISNDAQSNALRSTCETAARRDPRIQVHGPVARRDVGEVLAAWDVLCCPGLSLEGGPTVGLEALAVGTPIIGSRFGGLAEIVRDGQNGALVTPGDWRALADIIRAVALRPETIDEWRSRLPTVRSMRDVTLDYLDAYNS